MKNSITGGKTHWLVKQLLTLVVVSLALVTQGATFCVGPSATGNGGGADWNNVKVWSGGIARGDTWYLRDGTYPGTTFTAVESGTALVTIKKATVADHVTDTGWVSSYANQAIFSGTLYPQYGYFVFDGQTGDGAGSAPADATPSNYGFNLNAGVTGIYLGTSSGASHTDFTFKHIYAKASSADTEKMFCQGHQSVQQVDNNVTISHCLLDGWQGGFMTRGQGSGSYSNLVWEYNICLNGFSSSANHGEWINPNERPMLNAVFRYNIFKGSSGSSGMTGTIVANNSPNTGAMIYGNVFDGVRVGNGIISGTSAGNMNNAVVYNNTFLNVTTDSGPWVNGPGSGNVAYNNLFYNMSGSSGPGWSTDYDAFYSTTGTPSEAHGQIASGNPFTDSVGMNYTLKANTTAGTALSAPYNVDPLGKVRATWTRGAYEFGTAITNAMISITPTSLNFGSVVTNTTSDLTFTVRNVGASTLSGAVSIAAPFSVVSGGTYSLSANQSQAVTIRLIPTSVTSYSQNATFTGGGGATATVSAAGILASANTPPTVSAIAQNAADVDPGTAGIQVYEGTVVQYAGSASDANGNALTWQWIYTINGGAEVIYQSGAGAVTPVSFSYGAGTAAKTFLWKLRVSDGVATTESQLSVGISAPPVVGAGVSFEAEAGAITAPFVSASGAISQDTTTDLAGGGRATYTFTVTNAGEYAIQAYVNAPGLTENSFYVNIDGEPQDPAMAWDILPPTVGFENRLISWRGNGTADANELVPKFFNLAQGPHQLIIIGREANVQLDRFVIFKRPSAPSNLRSLASLGQ